MYKNFSECQKQYLYTTCSPQVWAWNFHVLNLSFNEQSVVILWVSWCKNKSFWQRFTCTRLNLYHGCFNFILAEIHCCLMFSPPEMIIHSYVQNFYLLKIHLNLFEISNPVLKFEIWFETVNCQVWNRFSDMINCSQV